MTPLTTADAMQVLFQSGFSGLIFAFFFASGEARAHLGHLVSSGRMDTFFDNGIEKFRLTDLYPWPSRLALAVFFAASNAAFWR